MVGGLQNLKELLGVSFWKEIMKELGWVNDNWKFGLGNEIRIRFWTDH